MYLKRNKMAVASEVHDISRLGQEEVSLMVMEEMDNNNLLRDYDLLLM